MLDDDKAAYAYLREGLTGASAKAIAAHLCGWGRQDGSYPHDAGDFGRCEALLDAIPELRGRLPEMAAVNAYWAALVPCWDEIRATEPSSREAVIRHIVLPIEDLDPGCARFGKAATLRAAPITFSAEEYHQAARAAAGKPPMRETEADRAVRDRAFEVTAAELRQFVERIEQLEAEQRDLAATKKEAYAEAKGRGHNTKVLRKLIALRKRKPDDVAEEQAVLDAYLAALRMA